jgi:shikimate kinase
MTVPDQCIAIVGMNGIGKSNFGKRLASKLQKKRIDTDIVFRKKFGKEHVYIQTHGWEAFRKKEEEIVCSSLLPNHIVILGGGAVESPIVRAALKEKAIVLWIQAEHAKVHKHLNAAKVPRPEFKDGVTEEAVGSLLETRNPLYEEVANLKLYPHVAFRDQVRITIDLLTKHAARTTD